MRFSKSSYFLKNPDATWFVIEKGEIEEIKKILKKINKEISSEIERDYIAGTAVLAIGRKNFYVSWYTKLSVHDYDYDNEYISLSQLRQIVKGRSR